MVFRDPYGQQPTFGGLGGPPPRDIAILLVVVFVTFSMQFFAGLSDLIALLRITPLAWQNLFVWQIFTYPFMGSGGASLWILLELLILYWFAGDVYRQLGRRRFWQLLLTATAGAGLVGVLVHLASTLIGAEPPNAFVLMQGQRILTLFAIAAFGTLRQNATILLFFVLPVQAKYFLPLEIVIGFIGFLGTKDLAGFVGVCTVVGLTWALLRFGGLQRFGKEMRLRTEKKLIERKLGKMRKKSKLRVVRGEDETRKGPWVN